MSRRLDQIIAVGLLVAVVFTALAHGAVEPWSVAVYALLLIGLIELWAIKAIVERGVQIVIPKPAFPLAGLILLGLAQSIAWTGGDGRRASLSLDVAATRGTVLILVLMLGAFLIATNFWTSRHRLQRLGWFLTSYGLAMAVFALIQYFTWNGRFYWVRQISALTAPFGPFLHHGLFAGYMELLTPIPIGMALMRVVERPARIFCVFAALIMSLATIISLSRGGMISLAAGLIFISVVGVRIVIERRRALEQEWNEEEDFDAPRRQVPIWLMQGAVVIATIVLIGSGVLWLGPDTVASRLTQGPLGDADLQGQNFYSSRGWIWRDTWAMITAHPMLGVGLGAYPTAFSLYTQHDGTYIADQAHNDYLQVLADGGIVGGLLALWFIITLVRAFARAAKARDGWRVALALGGSAGLFSLLVHSFFDFNLQIPSTALLFLILTAVVTRISETVTTSVSTVELESVSARAGGVVSR